MNVQHTLKPTDKDESQLQQLLILSCIPPTIKRITYNKPRPPCLPTIILNWAAKFESFTEYLSSLNIDEI